MAVTLENALKRRPIISVDMTRYPFHGIYAEVARDLGVTKSTIWKAVNRYQNPRILALVAKKIRQRTSLMQEVRNVAG